MKLIYVGDPMCSWCYGFGKDLAALMARVPDLRVEIVVGGVRAGATDVLDEAGKRFRLQHWTRVHATSAVPFNREAFAAREGFVYDTEPVCRAVVAARRIAGNDGLLNVFRAFQHAFYADGLDTTDGNVLTDIGVRALRATGVPVSVDEFFETWAADETIGETRRDFAHAMALGATSFPTLLLEQDRHVHVVTAGYASVDELEYRLNRLEAKLP